MKKLAMLMLLLLMPLVGQAGETAKTLLSVDLKQEPYADAATIANVPAATTVDVIKRRGGWVQVKPAGSASSDNTAGWLKMTSIKYGDTPAAKGESGWGSLLNVARSGRSGNTGVTVTTGVRGLSPEDLKNARPDTDAVKKLDSFPKGRSEAQTFASAGKLQGQQVEYIASTSITEKSGIGSFFNRGKK